MAFRAAGKPMAAGSYEIQVTRNTATELVYVRNIEARSTAILVAQAKQDPPKDWVKAGSPKLAFACAGSDCNLKTLWDGYDVSEYVFRSPKPPAGDLTARLELVTLSMIKVR